jgi:hypothetical protein
MTKTHIACRRIGQLATHLVEWKELLAGILMAVSAHWTANFGGEISIYALDQRLSCLNRVSRRTLCFGAVDLHSEVVLQGHMMALIRPVQRGADTPSNMAARLMRRHNTDLAAAVR